jgi:hypothetical protein
MLLAWQREEDIINWKVERDQNDSSIASRKELSPASWHLDFSPERPLLPF